MLDSAGISCQQLSKSRQRRFVARVLFEEFAIDLLRTSRVMRQLVKPPEFEPRCRVVRLPRNPISEMADCRRLIALGEGSTKTGKRLGVVRVKGEDGLEQISRLGAAPLPHANSRHLQRRFDCRR